MISQEVVAATPREGKFNKNAARRVRVKGKIPAVVYGAAEPAMAIEVDPEADPEDSAFGLRPQLDLRSRDQRIDGQDQGHDRRLAV